MSTSSSTIPATLLMAGALLLTPIAACSSEPASAPASAPPPVEAPEKKLQPLAGRLPADCETCGTVVAITQVDVATLPKPPAGADGMPPKQVFEVVVRLNAGTQQIITVDRAPQLTIGQRVRIIDGTVVPHAG